MISELAKNYIDSDTIEFRNGDRMVDASTVYTAVDIAEEEMIKKAVIAFVETCEMYAGNGKCLEGGECATCSRTTKFKQKLWRNKIWDK